MLRSLWDRITSWMSPQSREAHELCHQISSLYDEGRFGEAYAVCRAAVEKYPHALDSGDICVTLAELELSANMDHQEALRLLDRAAQKGYTKEADYYRVCGLALWESGQHAQAMINLERAAALDADPMNLVSFAERLSFLHDSRATDMWLRILDKEPNYCTAHAYLAREAIKAGDPSAALRWAKKAERLSPMESDLFEIGHIYHGLSRFADALRVYEAAREAGYDDKAVLLASIAACHISLGDPAQAKACLEEASLYDRDDDYVRFVWQEYDKARET